MMLTALFPGSFVLSFAYSEATMLLLAALACCGWCRTAGCWPGSRLR